ncbi:MAG: hypothetical protein CME32_15280 [Gimesia sp.]|nr:hypothetical protein [Gimesia sp.]
MNAVNSPMPVNSHFLVRRHLAVLLLTAPALWTACSGEETDQKSPTIVDPPAVLEIDGGHWQRETSIGKSDGDLLAHYFKANPSMVGSPELQGPPEVYHGTQRKRRFYWIKHQINQTVWTCVEYQAGSFHLSQGQGSPFK